MDNNMNQNNMNQNNMYHNNTYHNNMNYNNMYQNNGQLEQPLSLGEWILTLFVTGIPCIGIIMLFVWGFGQGNISRRNYCRAMLILTAVGIVLGIISYGTIVAVFMGTLGSLL